MESPQFLAEKLLAWGAIGGGRPIAPPSLSRVQSSAFSPAPAPQAHLTCPIKAAGASQEARLLLPLLGAQGRALFICRDGETSLRHPDLKTSPCWEPETPPFVPD